MVKISLLMRLTLGYIAILVLVIALGVYVAFNLNQINLLIRGTADDGATLAQMEHLLEAIFSQVSFERKYLISQDPDFKKKFRDIQDLIVKDLKDGEPRMNTARKKKLFSDTRNLYREYISLSKEETELMVKGQKIPSKKYMQKKDDIVDGINRKLKGIMNIVRSDRENKILSSSQISRRVLSMTVFTAILTVLLGILISFLNTRSINRSIILLQKKTKELAKGTYEKIPEIKAPPEIKALADDFNTMSDKLRRLDEMKVDFINHVSHELRTPLTAIKEASSMLMEGTYNTDAEKQHQLLTITQEECERLINSVNRILDFSRMEAQMMEYHFTTCNLVPVIQRTVKKLTPIAQSKNISLELKPPLKLPAVRIDEERIGQVLENLIANALKFTSEEGRIFIQTVPFNRKKNFVCVAVSDTGMGINAEHLEIIFDKYSRGQADGHKIRGSGLGLSIAKYIITDHGGQIWATSKPGKGSTFFFALPVA
jgi:two-component system sensor histidine kinase GlrK